MKKERKKNFLVVYGFSLLSIAFLLILLSYLSQIRASRQEIASLREESKKFTVSAMQSIEDLENDNRTLKSEVDLLKERDRAQQNLISKISDLNIDLEDKYDAISSELDVIKSQTNELNKKYTALLSMTKIDSTFTERKYSYTAYLIYEFAVEYVSPTAVFSEDTTDAAVENILDRYEEIKAWLEKRGYMDEEKILKWKMENIEE